jgi:ATP-dependent DNA helicase RecG
MTHDDLLDKLDQLRKYGAETPSVEAKRARTELPKRIWETLSAFANSPGGGTLLLGVDENAGFAAAGVDDPAKLQADLGALCSDQMEPPLRPLIQLWETDGRTVVSAEIPELPPEQKPCYYRGGGLPNGAFIRVGEGDRKLTAYEVQALFESRGQPRHDVEPLPGIGLGDLDADLVASVLQRLRARESGPYRTWSDEQILRSLRVLVPAEDGTLVVSLLGWLCFATYPQDAFPNLCVTFARYPTNTPGEPGPAGERFLDNAKMEGPVPQVVIETLRALKRNMQRRGLVQGLFREDMWEYPETVLREAIVNALGHRDLSPQARGAQVQVLMFPDRLEVLSPGGLFGPIQPDQLGELGVQSSRNAHLMKLLEDLPPAGETRPLCENRGTGLTSMIEQLRKAGMSPPRFDVTLTRFRLVLPNHTLYDGDTLDWLHRLGERLPLTEPQRQALAFVRHNESLTNADYRRLTGRDSRLASRDLSDLVSAGLLERTGAGRWTAYKLTDGDATSPSAGARRARLGERSRDILRLLAESPLSAREVAERLDLSASAARYWLRRITRSGLVESTGLANAPTNRYRLTDAGTELLHASDL